MGRDSKLSPSDSLRTNELRSLPQVRSRHVLWLKEHHHGGPRSGHHQTGKKFPVGQFLGGMENRNRCNGVNDGGPGEYQRRGGVEKSKHDVRRSKLSHQKMIGRLSRRGHCEFRFFSHVAFWFGMIFRRCRNLGRSRSVCVRRPGFEQHRYLRSDKRHQKIFESLDAGGARC